LDADVARQLAIDTAEEILERVRAIPVGGDETRFLLEQVYVPRSATASALTVLQWIGLPEPKKQVRGLLHRGGKLNSRMPKAVCSTSAELGGPGVLPRHDIVMADRLGLVQRHLDNESAAAPSMRAAMLRCQGKFLFETSVLQSTKAQESGWLESDTAEHGWLESLADWCVEKKIEIHGGCRLTGATTRDRSIVCLEDIVTPDIVGLLQRTSYMMNQH
jgi:hypothetical protein